MVGTRVFGDMFTLQADFIKEVARENRRAAEAYYRFLRSTLETTRRALHDYRAPQRKPDRQWMERVAYLKALEDNW